MLLLTMLSVSRTGVVSLAEYSTVLSLAVFLGTSFEASASAVEITAHI
jgi:hypothetical protein